MVDQELAEHSDPSGKREVPRTRAEQALERIAEQGMLLERAFLRTGGSIRVRIDQLLLGERVTDDLVRERPEEAALWRLFRLIEEIDDATMLFFQDVFQ